MDQITRLNLSSKEQRSATRILGETGERLARDFLVRRGYRIVCSNFTVPIGRNLRGAAITGEIDIVALDGTTLCFIEVKTRSNADFASPITAVDRRKQRQIIRAARIYRRLFRLEGIKYRYDAIAVVISGRPSVEHFPNFWDESRFEGKNWDRFY